MRVIINELEALGRCTVKKPILTLLFSKLFDARVLFSSGSYSNVFLRKHFAK